MKPTDHTNFQQRARVDRRQRQPGPGHIVFRPNLGSVHKTGGQGHKFSASQVISSHLARRQKVCLEWCVGSGLSVWLRGDLSWCDKNKDGPWAVLSTLTTHSVRLVFRGNFLSCFQTWQSSNDLFAIKLSALRMYWQATGYFFLILIACNLEWLLSRLVCQVVSSLMLMARLDTKENSSSRRNLTETVKDPNLTSWLQIPPQSSDCVKNNWFDNCFLRHSFFASWR